MSSKYCVVIPTYNNASTIEAVIDSVCVYAKDIIVVNDGSTDATAQILEKLSCKIRVVGYEKNRGKGYALKRGFEAAAQQGFDYAITIDSDGQHLASDLPAFVEAIESNGGALIVGARGFGHANMPQKNTFANRFSNFWFNLQTLSRLSDTQTGFRAYPLKRVASMKMFTSRYECELEIMVRLKWRGVRIKEIPISVIYQPAEERVSHFRPGRDFLRISLLNTFMTILAFVYGYPSMLYYAIKRKC